MPLKTSQNYYDYCQDQETEKNMGIDFIKAQGSCLVLSRRFRRLWCRSWFARFTNLSLSIALLEYVGLPKISAKLGTKPKVSFTDIVLFKLRFPLIKQKGYNNSVGRESLTHVASNVANVASCSKK